MSELNVQRKSLDRRDIALFTVSAILLVDTLAASASIGTYSLFWWLFLGVFFYVPFALICAELGCSFPAQGGIYAWVRDAFGRRWGSRITWSYWVNVAIWMPAIFILFSGVVQQLFNFSLSNLQQILLGIGLSWLAVAANVITLDVGKWVPNLGAIFKVVIFIAIIIGAILHVSGNGWSNEISLQSLSPSWEGSVQYIPAIIYGMLGFELISAKSEEMRNPAKDVPRAVLSSGVVIIFLYVAGTAAILAALPAEEIDLVDGLVDTLTLFFSPYPYGEYIVLALGVAALYTFFSNGVTWAMGGNSAIAEAAIEGEMPVIFAMKSKRRGTPVGAAVTMGVVSSVVLLLYGFLVDSDQNLFWSLFSFSGVIFLIPYVAMVLAFFHFRLKAPHHKRPFKIVGGTVVAFFLTLCCVIILIAAITLFLYSPGEGVQWPVLIGVAIILLLGEVAICFSEKNIVPDKA